MDSCASRLLVVDDSSSMRRVIRSVLNRLGLEYIDQACDGVEGFEMYEKAHYDLVVSDLAMPRMTGIEMVRQIRAMVGRPRTPVLLVSGQLSERNIREAVEAGVDGFVAKPFVEAPLARGVSRLLVGSPGAPHGSDRDVSHTQSLFGSSGTGHGP